MNNQKKGWKVEACDCGSSLPHGRIVYPGGKRMTRSFFSQSGAGREIDQMLKLLEIGAKNKDGTDSKREDLNEIFTELHKINLPQMDPTMSPSDKRSCLMQQKTLWSKIKIFARSVLPKGVWEWLSKS